MQGQYGAAVAGVWGFHLGEDAGHVGSVDDVCFYEFGKLVFFCFHIQIEIKVLGIYFADVKIGDIAHQADGERDVKLHRVGFCGIRG